MLVGLPGFRKQGGRRLDQHRTSAPSPALAVPLLAALLSSCSPPAEASASGAVARDLDGESVDALAAGEARAVALLFVMPDCPIANAYAPEIRRIQEDYAPRGVAFRLVYADRDVTADRAREHLREFELDVPALLDPDRTLTAFAGARVSPEAAVYSPSRELLYRGRIDDRYVDFGIRREIAEETDLRDALDAILADRPVARPRTTAVGCFLPDAELPAR